ncbi:MAG TPA: glycosyltransferase family 39 protein [Ktedonobacteraceae bacterium]|nr:glycosyltransferase family 39 protein [Ktedonobacteraceae bacterium]
MIESSPVPTTPTPKMTFRSSGKDILSQLPLALILLMQAIVSLLTLRNTAFQDEALYLLAGKEIVLSWQGKVSYLEPYGSYFSGYPSFYPVIGGLLASLGGLEAARLFSLLCMLIVTICVYFVTIEFFDRKSALIAAFFFACEGSVLFVGRLATYDSLCFCLLALAMMLCLRASKAVSARSLLGLGPLLVLAVAAKYAGLLFIPSVLALLAWWSWQHKGSEEMIVRPALGIFSLVVVGFIAYQSLDQQVLTGLSFTTTNRSSFIGTPPLQVLQHILTMEGIFFALTVLGLCFCGKQRLPGGLILLSSALLVPFYHTYKGEMVSLDKHLAFSMFFLAPLAGFAIVSLVALCWKRLVALAWGVALALCLLALPLGMQQARNLFADWPSSTQLIALLQPRVHRGNGHYLIEDYDVSRYYLQNETDIWEWTSLDYFVYTDKARHNLSGDNAYKAAIKEGYFDLIELSYGYHAGLSMQLEQTLTASKQYDFVGKVPFHNAYGDGYYWLWKKHSS